MPATLLAKCPGCKKVVRIREDWANKTVRCKVCGMICQAKPTAAYQARQAAGAKASAPVPVQPAVAVAAAPASPFAFPAAAGPAAEATYVPPHGAETWAGIDDHTFNEPAGPVIVPNYRRKNRSGPWVFVALLVLLLCLGGTAGAIFFLAPAISATWSRASGGK